MHRQSRKAMVAATLVLPVAAALLSGCGGSGKSETVEMQGVRLPKAMGEYTLCQLVVQEGPQQSTDTVKAGEAPQPNPVEDPKSLAVLLTVPYFKLDAKQRDAANDGCPKQDTEVPGYNLQVLRYASPEIAQHRFGDVMSKQYTEVLDGAHCDSAKAPTGKPASECFVVNGETVFVATVRPESGMPTRQELAQAPGAVSAVQ